MADPIGTALDAMTDSLAEATRRLAEIEDERGAAIARIDALRAAIRATLPLLPGAERDRRLAALAEVTPGPARPAPPLGRSPRMAAVMQVLAAHPTATIRVGELQRHLAANALARDSRTAARALAKKARQGIVERIDRGTYRIATDHRALLRIRQELA